MVFDSGFEYGDTSVRWAATGCTPTVSGTFAGPLSGASVAKLTTTATTATFGSDQKYIQIVPSNPNGTKGVYTFSGYVSSATADVVTPKILWYNSSGTLISTSSGTPVTLGTGAWVRVSVTDSAPSTTLNAVYRFDFATASGRVIYVDDALFEESPYVQPYFGTDSSGAGTGYYQTSDLSTDAYGAFGWVAYYKNLNNALARLKAELPNYLPFGCSWTLQLNG